MPVATVVFPKKCTTKHHSRVLVSLLLTYHIISKTVCSRGLATFQFETMRDCFDVLEKELPHCTPVDNVIKVSLQQVFVMKRADVFDTFIIIIRKECGGVSGISGKMVDIHGKSKGASRALYPSQRLPVISIFSNFRRSSLCSTLSKAFLKSN